MKNDGFVYCWTDHKTLKVYVGVHKGTLDDGYVTSSKHFNKEYKQRPMDFTRQIIAEGEYKDMRRLETTILQSANARNDPTYYNRHNGGNNFYCDQTGTKHSDETKSKMSASNKGKNSGRKRPYLSERNKLGHSEETRKKLGRPMVGAANPMFGKPRTLEWKNKHSKTMKGRYKGRVVSEETKLKMAEARKKYWERKRDGSQHSLS